MTDELSPEERFSHEDESIFVPRDLAAGVPEDEIVRKLVRLDWAEWSARAYVQRFRQELQAYHSSPEDRAELVEHYFRLMIAGAVLLFVGVLVSVLTFLVAFSVGGVAIIFVGFVLTGLIMFSNGYSKWALYRRDDLQDD